MEADSDHGRDYSEAVDGREELTNLTAASDLPEPESSEEYSELPPFPPGRPVAKGIAGAFARSLKGIPPCVWVSNQHDDEITVVVSKHRPNRLLSGVEFNISATGGGGVGFYSTTYMGPATTKTLSPETKNRQASLAVFPLWTRSDGFGVVTVFKGLDRLLYIENDRIPAGATAYFRNTPDLTIVTYGGQPALSQ